MKTSKIPKLCQNIGACELFQEKKYFEFNFIFILRERNQFSWCQHSPSLRRRLTINETVNPFTKHMNKNNTHLLTIWWVNYLIPPPTEFFWGFLSFVNILPILAGPKLSNIEKVQWHFGSWLNVISSIPSERAMFLLQISAIKFLGYLKLRNSSTPNRSDTKVKTRHCSSRITKRKINNVLVKSW